MAYTSQYPTQDADHVKATTTQVGTSSYPYYATDPTKTLTGNGAGNQWQSADFVITNQRFHIDLGSAVVIKRIYYENYHTFGLVPERGINNFTFWGSNTAGSFAELTYTTDTGWTQLTTSQSTFDIHVALDQADPKYITVTNTTAYRYYAFKIADNYGGADSVSVRRIELQIEGFVQTLSDTITPSDKKNVSPNKLCVGSVTTSDTHSRIWGMERTKTDTMPITDTYNRIWGMTSRTFPETITLSDLIKRNIGKGLNDAISISELIGRIYAITKTDNLAISDIRILVLNREYSDSITISDILGRNRFQYLIEIIVLSDTVTKVPEVTTWGDVVTGSGLWSLVSSPSDIWV